MCFCVLLILLELWTLFFLARAGIHSTNHPLTNVICEGGNLWQINFCVLLLVTIETPSYFSLAKENYPFLSIVVLMNPQKMQFKTKQNKTKQKNPSEPSDSTGEIFFKKNNFIGLIVP